MKQDDKITVRQAYEAVLAFLNAYASRTAKPQINSLILSMMTDDEGIPVDDAVTRDWRAAVGAAQKGQISTGINPRKDNIAIDPLREFRHMQSVLDGHDITRLERSYFNMCSLAAGKRMAEQIMRVDLHRYKTELRDCLRKALKTAHVCKAKALYFEYDLDNNWESHVFVCPKYRKAGCSNDWASSWTHQFKGPKERRFCRLYLDTDTFCATARAAGITLLLIARTISAVADVAQSLSIEGIVITAAYHDQNPIMRING